MKIKFLILVLLVTPALISGCFTKQARQDQAEVNIICEEEDIRIECKISQAYLTLAAINKGMTSLVLSTKGTDKEAEVKAIANNYYDQLPKAELALSSATVLAGAQNKEGAVAKLQEATKIIKVWEEYKQYGE